MIASLELSQKGGGTIKSYVKQFIAFTFILKCENVASRRTRNCKIIINLKMPYGILQEMHD